MDVANRRKRCLTAGAGIGGTGEKSIVLGFSWKNGFQFGTYDAFGGGFGSVSASVVVDITFSTNADINDLAGIAGTIGKSGSAGISVGGETKRCSAKVEDSTLIINCNYRENKITFSNLGWIFLGKDVKD